MDDKGFLSGPATINIEDIMREIRTRLANTETPLKFTEISGFEDLGKNVDLGQEPPDYNAEVLDESIRQNNQNWDVNSEGHITSHRKFIGSMIVLGKRIIRKSLRWYILRPWQQQIAFNASVARSINELAKISIFTMSKDNKNRTDYEGKLALRITNLEAMFQKLFGELTLSDEEKVSKYEHIMARIDQFESATKGFTGEAQTGLKSEGESNTQTLNEMKRYIDQTTLGFGDELLFISERTRRLERSRKDQVIQVQGMDEVKPSSENVIEFDYFMFEQRFRGSRQEIKERQRFYVDHFKNKREVVDLGCGRGEFLELMRESGISAIGVDSNPDMVSLVRDLGLNVECVEVSTYLKEMTRRIDGIFSAQLIEHLSPAEMLDLIRICYDKLDHGGILALETVNPTCLSVFAESFYMDLSHVRPVHPATLAFVLKQEGFINVQTLYLSPFSDSEKIPNIPMEGFGDFNAGIERLNSRLFSYRDYAIIGEKR